MLRSGSPLARARSLAEWPVAVRGSPAFCGGGGEVVRGRGRLGSEKQYNDDDERRSKRVHNVGAAKDAMTVRLINAPTTPHPCAGHIGIDHHSQQRMSVQPHRTFSTTFYL